MLFWRDNVASIEPVPLLGKASEFNVFTDASDVAAAGYIEHLGCVMHKCWSAGEKLKSSTWREIKAIELSLYSFISLFKDSTVSFYTDNKNAVSVVHKGSKNHELQMLALAIFECCNSSNITIFVRWIPREFNDQADMLSRIVDVDDWRISDEFFNFLQDIWGQYTIDRFANMDNTKLPRFNSLYWNPGSGCIDAFTCNWAQENNWLVPPVSMVSKAVNHLVKCKALGTLIVPKWPSSPFWPLLFDTGYEYREYVMDVLEFHETDRIFRTGNNTNSLFAKGNFTGKVLAVKLDASRC